MHNKVPKLGINHDIGYNIFKISQIMKRELIRQLKIYKITPEQMAVIRVLSIKNRITQSEICKMTQQDPPTITRTMKRMERGGFIRKKVYYKDKRAVKIVITNKGRKLGRQIPVRLKNHFDELLNQFSKKKKELLRGLLVELHTILCDSVGIKKHQ